MRVLRRMLGKSAFAGAQMSARNFPHREGSLSDEDGGGPVDTRGSMGTAPVIWQSVQLSCAE
ncbi:MAG: hypothetical protein K0R53_2225 [Burkholderiales bacterium]|jgi:hypothetical protein|nr:hypothetical protein [Burkholderiales bacterium]